MCQSLEDLHTRVESQSVVIEDHQKSEGKRQELEKTLQELEKTLQELQESKNILDGEITDLKSQNLALVSDLEVQKRSMEQETADKLELEAKKWLSVERERDRLKGELADVHSSVENEMSALKFKLSSINFYHNNTLRSCGSQK